MKKFGKIIITLLILLVIAAAGYMLYIHFFPNKISEKGKIDFKSKKPKLKVLDTESDERPIAVVHDNHTGAWPHSGLSQAYMIYEFPVEGGESRILAFYKNKENLEQVGPVRSARHYFLDYVLEHDAIFTHFGKSPKAGRDMQTLGINNVSGQSYDTMKPKKGGDKEFWRVPGKERPHDAYTTMKNIMNIAKSLNYRMTTEKKPLLKYSILDVDLPEDTAQSAGKVISAFHRGNETVFEYNPETKLYTRKGKGVLQKEELTGEPLTVKNIIIMQTNVRSLNDGSHKGRKDIDDVGTFKGIYVTNGKAINITINKPSRAAQTKYTTEDGKEVVFNDGITYKMIIPNGVGYKKIEPLKEPVQKDKTQEQTKK